MTLRCALIAALLLGAVLPVGAQEKKEAGSQAYQVEFDLRDGSDGPSRHYSMRIDEGRKGVFQAASRIPAAVGSRGYVDVGVNIECTVLTSAGKAALQGIIEVTSIDGQIQSSATAEPIIGQRKMAFDATVEVGAPAIVIDARNASGAATHRVEATVTKVK